MYSIKIENGHSAISGSSVKLRTKFIKHFPSLQLITKVNLCALDVLHIHVKKWGVFAEMIINKYNCVG